jgi:hypothetical protein
VEALVFRKRRNERKLARTARLLVALATIAAASRPEPRRRARIAVR